jgi:hypothetical protein
VIQLGQTTSLRAERCPVGLLIASQTEVAKAVHCGGNRTRKTRSVTIVCWNEEKIVSGRCGEAEKKGSGPKRSET